MSLKNFILEKITVEEYLKEQKQVDFKKIEFSSIVFSAFSHLKCMNCGMFRRNYHCLATPRWKKAKEILSKYDNFYLIYISIDNSIRVEEYKKKREEMKKQGKRVFSEWLLKRNACNANQVQIYSKIKKFLIEFKKTFPKKKIRAFGSGGGCRSCKVCGLVNQHTLHTTIEPCKKPNESFGAPESWGIDVYATLTNNNIKFEVIPENILITVGLIVEKI